MLYLKCNRGLIPEPWINRPLFKFALAIQRSGFSLVRQLVADWRNNWANQSICRWTECYQALSGRTRWFWHFRHSCKQLQVISVTNKLVSEIFKKRFLIASRSLHWGPFSYDYVILPICRIFLKQTSRFVLEIKPRIFHLFLPVRTEFYDFLWCLRHNFFPFHHLLLIKRENIFLVFNFHL